MGYHENPPYYLTAYDLAVKWGFRGTEQDWLNSLTAYGIAQQAGYRGTAQDWIETLIDPVPNIQIGEVVTLDGGMMATASFTGDKRNPILNLGIPRGVGQTDALPFAGGTMKGDINMDGHTISGLADPTEDSHAVPKSYADMMLPKSGGTMEGALNVQEPTEDSHAVPKSYADMMLPKSGGSMDGALNVQEPTEDSHAAPKSYVDAVRDDAKKYADEKHLSLTVSLLANGWMGNAAPYKQTVAAPGMKVTDHPHWAVVLSDDRETAISEMDGYAVVDDIDSADDSVTFTCLKETPDVDLTIQMEVNR